MLTRDLFAVAKLLVHWLP